MLVISTRHEGDSMTERKALPLRLPIDLKRWIEEQAEANGSSQNSEVIRAVRERMVRTEQAQSA